MIDKIKTLISIVDLAERYNAEPVGGGNVLNTRKNPLRDEKSSSLKLYRSSNTFFDFGSGVGGSVIDFYALANNISITDAIKALKNELHLEGDIKEAHKYVVETEYMKPSVVKKIFEKQIKIDEKKHKKELLAIAPQYLYDNAHEVDKQSFFDIVRIDVQNKTDDATAVVLLSDENGIPRSMRYRRKAINGDLKKWVALQDTQSSVHYTRIKDNAAFTIIVEGTHDYLTAILAGYSVIAIPSAKFKIDSALLENKLCVFIDDDDGKNSMLDNFNNAICEKIFFNHADFKKLIKNDTAKDFSDYLELFENLHEFKSVFDDFVLSSKLGEQNHFLDVIGRGITIEDLKNIKQETAIYDGFIYEKNINMIFADGGVGKSVLSLSLCNYALANDKADIVLYIDADNGASTIKARLPQLLEIFGEKLQYYGLLGKDREDIVAIIEKLGLIKNNKQRVIIVIDSLSFFIDGTVNDDSVVKPFVEKIKKLRDNFGATILLLHHVRKPNKEDKFPTFVGSVVIKNSCDTAWSMIRNKDKVIIKKEKARPIDAHEMFSINLNQKTMTINEIEQISENEESKEDSDMSEDVADNIQKYLNENKDGISANKFKDAINLQFNYNYNKKEYFDILNNIKYKNVRWTMRKIGENWTYFGIRQKSETVTTEYRMSEDEIIKMEGGFLF
jgi:hypothetical protein